MIKNSALRNLVFNLARSRTPPAFVLPGALFCLRRLVLSASPHSFPTERLTSLAPTPAEKSRGLHTWKVCTRFVRFLRPHDSFIFTGFQTNHSGSYDSLIHRSSFSHSTRLFSHGSLVFKDFFLFYLQLVRFLHDSRSHVARFVTRPLPFLIGSFYFPSYSYNSFFFCSGVPQSFDDSFKNK